MELLTEIYNKRKPTEDNLSNAVSKFQKAVVEDSLNTFRPRSVSLELDE